MRRKREQRRAREQQPRCGKVAGGTVAECTAVFCCFPFAVVELVILAAIRVPAALCRRAVQRERRRTALACNGRARAATLVGEATGRGAAAGEEVERATMRRHIR
uniref:Uncharacterized protein n=1 Tax=Oryza sativa subsp. japonica TaxID=39947 RepID=Q69KJ1_ORYSJ|nr:hypothetical protein [Oryza sativa Japonica Group]